MEKLVTIGITVSKRLQYLPNVLGAVKAQDYGNIDLLVSDNGLNGELVPQIVKRCYPRLFRFRQNPAIVDLSSHYNQILQEARGEYFILLADDDEITPNYVSDLVSLIDRNPKASAAIAAQQTMNEAGQVIRSSETTVPESLSGLEFIRAAWGTHEYRFESFSTFLGKRKQMIECGGFPKFRKGTAIDDALLVKLTLDNFVALSGRCAFRKRFDDSSHGYALPIEELAGGIRDFLQFLDFDPALQDYGRIHPAEWQEAKSYLVNMAWKTYFYRWSGLYKNRLTSPQWVRAGFAMPFIPPYYRAVQSTLMGAALSMILAQVNKYIPSAYDIYRSVKSRYRRAAH